MLPLLPRRLAPALALSLLCLPLLVRAQTPAAKPDAVLQVRLQLNFISISTDEFNDLGITFDPSPYSPPKDKSAPEVIQIKTAAGHLASLLYQVVMRPRGDRVLSVPAVIAADKTTAKFVEDTKIVYKYSSTIKAQHDEADTLPLQTSLSIRPRVNADGSVTLIFVPLDGDLNASPKALKVPIAKTVSSGQVILLAGLPMNREKPKDNQKLFVFVTPTVLGSKAAAVDANGSQ